MTRFRGAIFDIDGVLQFQGQVCIGAVETLDALRAKGIVVRLWRQLVQKG